MSPAQVPKITPELVKTHGLKPEEYARFVKLLGRQPSITELGICSAIQALGNLIRTTLKIDNCKFTFYTCI